MYPRRTTENEKCEIGNKKRQDLRIAVSLYANDEIVEIVYIMEL